MLLEKLGTPRTSEEPMSLPNSKIIFARETWLNKIAQNWDGQDILIYEGEKKTFHYSPCSENPSDGHDYLFLLW